jgi:hypothetical protein
MQSQSMQLQNNSETNKLQNKSESETTATKHHKQQKGNNPMGPSASPTKALPKRARRSAAKSTLPATSASPQRLLSLPEAAKLVDSSVLLSSMPTHSAETSKKDSKVLKMYESVTGTTKIRRRGIILFLRAVVERQKHLKENLDAITTSNIQSKGYRFGKAKVMSLNTFRFCYVSVLRRMYKKQKPNKLSWSGRTDQDVKRIDLLAKSILGPSKETCSVGYEETTLLISALGQGARGFFSHASLMTALLETGRRVGCFNKRLFKHITSIKDITDSSKKDDPRACLIEVTIKRYKDKGEGLGETDEHDVILRGSLFSNDYIDSVYFLHRRCLQDFGVPLFDTQTNLSILDHISADSNLHFVLQESLFEVAADRAYELFHRAQDNTSIPNSFNLRPHSTRKHLFSAGVCALESGELPPESMNGLRSQMGHTPYSRSGRQFYLGSDYLRRLNYCAIFHPNPVVRQLGVNMKSKSMQEKFGLSEPPRCLWKRIPKNFEIVEDIVLEKLSQKDAKKFGGDSAPRFIDRPSKARVDRKVSKLLLRFGNLHCPEYASMTNADKTYHVKNVIIDTLSSGLCRDQMIDFIERSLLSNSKNF